MSESRPVRNLAAWGYESTDTGTRVEVDVWTINRAVRDRDDALERAREAFASEPFEPIDAAGNVAKVRYPGIETIGYRYIDSGEKATQQAFAGAKRSAGGNRKDDGTFGDGWSVPDDAPDLEACVAHGEYEVIPAAIRDMMEAGAIELANKLEGIGRDTDRDEDEEATQGRPFSGFRNAIRIYPRGGSEFEYSVNVNRDSLKRQ